MDSVNVRSIHALHDLRSDLARFSGDAQDAINIIAQDILRTRDWLAERQVQCQAECRRREGLAQQAARALERCQTSGRSDSRSAPNCTRQQEALRQTLSDLRATQTELQQVRQWMERVDAAAQKAVQQMKKLEAVLHQEVPKGMAVLERAEGILAGYTATTLPNLGIEGSFAVTVLSALASEQAISLDQDISVQSRSVILPDLPFQDAKGQQLVMRLYPSNNQYFLRVFKQELHPTPPERPAIGDAGYANLSFEPEQNRIHLQDILVPDTYREAGIGSYLLEQTEEICRQVGVEEIYGDAPDNATTIAWYQRRGYELRNDGREIYKEFAFEAVGG